ncbi:MAG: TRAP transporter substrate-binding protein DctP [gamma proteobacterium symbiont of Taylorina sp.]|nr:TRAP transporter substrate-binding protein DctP [gamma proteobacterium symbiont of Taylorina sp.]
MKNQFIKQLISIFCVLSSLVLMTAHSVHAKTLKIATLSPEGSDWMIKMHAGAEEIKQKTLGRVKLKFYPGGVMGDDKAVLRKVRIGQLQGGAMTGGSLLKANSNYQIYNLLLSYKNQGEIDYVRKHIDADIIKGFEKGGFVILGMAESGFAYAMSSKKAIHNIAQLRQQKVWVPSQDMLFQKTLQSFGVTAIPLPFGDVLAGLQTGLINTVAMSPIGAIALQWYTQINYITDMPLLYTLGLLAIDKKAFNKIKNTDQKIVLEIMDKTFKLIDNQNKKNNKEALGVLKNNGIEFIKPSSSDLEEWQSLADQANQKLVNSGTLDAKLLKRVQHLLKQYRQNNLSHN